MTPPPWRAANRDRQDNATGGGIDQSIQAVELVAVKRVEVAHRFSRIVVTEPPEPVGTLALRQLPFDARALAGIEPTAGKPCRPHAWHRPAIPAGILSRSPIGRERAMHRLPATTCGSDTLAAPPPDSSSVVGLADVLRARHGPCRK
jgi:hypothetical protein